jgi:hypothetical protein
VKILSIAPSSGGAGTRREIARFDVDIDENIRFNHMRLMEEPSGRRAVYSPKVSHAGRAISFSLKLAQEMTRVASVAYDEMKGLGHNVNHSA